MRCKNLLQGITLSLLAFIAPSTFGQTWVESSKLVTSTSTSSSYFGYDVDLNGQIGVAGAYGYPWNELGTDSLFECGAAFVLGQNLSGVWGISEQLDAPDRGSNNRFGFAVAANSNYVFVGAPFESEDENGLNTQSKAGAVYVYEKNGSGGWDFLQKIVALDRRSDDEFGSTLRATDSDVLVGAYGQEYDESGMNQAGLAGAVYVLQFNSTSGLWEQSQKVVAPDRSALDYFGSELDLDGTNAVIGAFRDADGLVGSANMVLAGSVYIFEKQQNGQWVFGQKIVAPDRTTDDRFGRSVTIHGDWISVGATYEDHFYINKQFRQNAGAAYVYNKVQGSWSFFQKLNTSDRQAFDALGSSMSFDGESLVISAASQDYDAAGLDFKDRAGAAYVFMQNGLGFWEEVQKISVSDRASFDDLNAVAVEGKSLLVGTYGKTINNATSSGAVYGISLVNNPNIIQGTVYADFDKNCTLNNSDSVWQGVIVKATPGPYYGITDEYGNYSIQVDSGTYTVEQLPPNTPIFVDELCPGEGAEHTVQFDTLDGQELGLDYGNEALACPYLQVSVASNRRRRCFLNTTVINYCNDGYDDANNVVIHLQLPEFVSLINSDQTYLNQGNGYYQFEVGELKVGECGSIKIIDSVDCVNGITGMTQCTKVWVTPLNECIRNADTSTIWDKSSITVGGNCENDTATFVIYNSGSGNMHSDSEFRIYSDSQLVYTSAFRLASQDSLVIIIPGNGTTLRLEADQHPEHPGNSRPRVFIEGCGTNNGGTISLHQIIPVPQDDEDAEVEIECLEIRDSYDPNDKQVTPTGWSLNKYVAFGTELNYKIRFQNTGTDTAYRVVIADTLSDDLDVSSLKVTGASHSFTYSVQGKERGVLVVAFEQIYLPDSLTDPLGSQGYVTFKIRHQDGLVPKTKIENTAAIYFDFNLPVITNISEVTLFDSVYENTEALDTIIVQRKKGQPTGLSEFNDLVEVYPNPANTVIMISLQKLNWINRPVEFNLYSTDGRLVKSQIITNPNLIERVELGSVSPGLYRYSINLPNQTIKTGKLSVIH